MHKHVMAEDEVITDMDLAVSHVETLIGIHEHVTPNRTEL